MGRRQLLSSALATAVGAEAGASASRQVTLATVSANYKEGFEQVARSFENPDWVDVTLHAYRARWGEAPPDAHSLWLEERVKETRSLSLPALIFQGAKDGVVRPDGARMIAEKFDGPFEYVVLPEVGHFPTREAPDMVGELLIEHFGGC